MAWLCPFTDGLAVYQARGLMHAWDDSTFYFNPCEINAPQLNSNSRLAETNGSNENSNPINISVYPNPSNGNLLVNSNVKDCIFEIYDVIGKKIMSQKLNETETKVDVSSLNNGTYLYKIMQNNNLIKADKLILKN